MQTMKGMDNLTAHKAADYDEHVRRMIPFYEVIHNQVIQLAQAVRPDANVWVDTGCGTGYLVEQAMAAFPNTKFILADPSEAMLEQTRKRLTSTPLERLTILPAVDSTMLGSQVKPGSVDVVTAIQCHHYLQPDGRRRAVRACFDLLTPGGLFVTSENIAARTEEGTKIGLKRWKAFQMTQGKSEEEADKHLARYGTEFFPITVDQHVQVFAEVGFRVVELFWFSEMQAGFYGVK